MAPSLSHQPSQLIHSFSDIKTKPSAQDLLVQVTLHKSADTKENAAPKHKEKEEGGRP